MTGDLQDTELSSAYTMIEGKGPLVAVAIHDGHALRPEVESLMALPEETRFREEDPFTGLWTEIAPTRIIAKRSRFEVDLNRPRDRSVYIEPQDAWGLKVWKHRPTVDVVDRSLKEYDTFYQHTQIMLDSIVKREGRFVIFDLHTYNHRRAGPGALFDAQSKHPDVNIGTGTMPRLKWARIIDRVVSELKACEYLGRQLDVRENVKFYGGAFTRWVHETYPETGCSIAIEFKKFFMDEWSGQLYVDLHRGILKALQSIADAVLRELNDLDWKRQVSFDASSATLSSNPINGITESTIDRDTNYGHFLVGVWRCSDCGVETFPQQLLEKRAQRPFRCPHCHGQLVYREIG